MLLLLLGSRQDVLLQLLAGDGAGNTVGRFLKEVAAVVEGLLFQLLARGYLVFVEEQPQAHGRAQVGTDQRLFEHAVERHIVGLVFLKHRLGLKNLRRIRLLCAVAPLLRDVQFSAGGSVVRCLFHCLPELVVGHCRFSVILSVRSGRFGLLRMHTVGVYRCGQL